MNKYIEELKEELGHSVAPWVAFITTIIIIVGVFMRMVIDLF